MAEQLATGAEALRLFFTDDLFLIREEENIDSTAAVIAAVAAAQKAAPAAEVANLKAEAENAQTEAAVVTEAPAAKIEIPITEATIAPTEAATVKEPTVVNIEIPVIAAAQTSIPTIDSTVPQVPVIETKDPAAKEPAVKEAQTPVNAALQDFKYLGKNQKNVLILVNDQENETSTERGRELLRNIVKALQLTANDFALVNYAAYENTAFNTLTTFFKSRLVLSFGVAAAQLGLGEQGLNVLHNEGAVQLVFSKNLDMLADSLQDKKALWGSLKQITL